MAGTPDEDGAAAGALEGPDAAALRWLRGLVTALTAVMILGILAVVALLVIRLPDVSALAAPPLPDALRLPAGAEPLAVTQGRGWFAVVTEDDRILIFGADGALRQEVRVEAGE